MNMATQMITVNIPDHAPVKLPKSLTLEEIRATLASQGFPSVETARAEVASNGDVSFQRPTGGVKGL